MNWKKLFTFDEMIAPKIITVLYWLMLAALLIQSLGMMFSGGFGGPYGRSAGGFQAFLLGLFMLIVGAIAIRIWCELLIVLFKMHDHLKAIRENLGKS